MPFTDIVGQERPISLLTGALRKGALHHAMLFAGPEGVGKELTALTLAQAANCDGPARPSASQGLFSGMEREAARGHAPSHVPSKDACGECPSCRRIAGRNHPDILWLMSEAEQVERKLAGRADFSSTPSREIRIAQIRALPERLALKALEAKRKFAIIVGAEAMNTAAQNAFLKLLEEPPDATSLILISHAPDQLLPTIRSRCMKLSFNPLPLDFVAKRVMQAQKLDEESARLCAAMAEGSLAAALALDPKTLAKRRALIERVEQLAAKGVNEAFALAAEFGEEREEAEAHLMQLETWFRDTAAAASGAEERTLINRDLAPLAYEARSQAGWTLAEPLRRIELCREARAALRGNGSPKLQLEAFFLRLLYPEA